METNDRTVIRYEYVRPCCSKPITKVSNVHILSMTTVDAGFIAFRQLLLCPSTALLSRFAVNIRTILITNLSLGPTAERTFQNW